MAQKLTSNLRQALSQKSILWGGWITGPTLIGPDEFARAGYDYVGFDAQHGYLDDAEIAATLRHIEHLPIGTVVRLPDAAPAPIGRVLDAGADAVVVAMIESAEQAAAAVAATRYPPLGIRSFGPLRASLGFDAAALAARAGVFAMIETAAALSDLDRICAVEGLAGIYVGPADLAISMGFDAVGAIKKPEVLDTIVRIHRTATAAGLVTGIHAGDGEAGRAMRQLGFRMVTLAAESQALRRGAAEYLREATTQ
ncbi:aldolase [Mycobacterium sp. 852002-51163_SCH5372311]|uniref:HpcH/HpaI aldolase family protein n=1 Tax=Mycobacterium sp. 852002-51163_SCH5372311 TaxID=1834097 RepID=UPI000801E1D5|nr:aldolase/citrate lyase family protein [Mycobacterium sp. 852002-51163_SCH5372311]OBF80028.1 aldolase [Mycobacterium sp. 852002-51163_SCH5372311]